MNVLIREDVENVFIRISFLASIKIILMPLFHVRAMLNIGKSTYFSWNAIADLQSGKKKEPFERLLSKGS
jgi:hypothetical protein